PLRVERTTTVKVRAFAAGLDDRFARHHPGEGGGGDEAVVVAAGSLAQGLSCRTYAGEWPKPPDFSTLKPTGELVLATLGVPADRPTDNIGMACQGFLAVPADGLYTFKLRSADASDLHLDGQIIVENESPDFISRFGTAAL